MTLKSKDGWLSLRDIGMVKIKTATFAKLIWWFQPRSSAIVSAFTHGIPDTGR